MMINSERLLNTFFEYVRIDSETLNEGAMIERLRSDLQALGCEVWTDRAGSALGSNGNNLYARLSGDKAAAPLLFSAHVDTVKPGNGIKPRLEDGVIAGAGDTILGSDDKSGVSGIVEALRCVIENDLPHRTIEAMFSICEEGGLNGAKNADFSRLESKQAVVLDSSGDVGDVITVAPGQIKLIATVVGKSAHAGIAPETGVSAIQAAAAGVADMKLLRVDPETTANIGVFKSEYATNIVPDRAYIEGEARSLDTAKLMKQADSMKKCLEEACERYGAKLDCRIETAYLSYGFAENDPLIIDIKSAFERIEVTPALKSSGGGSDANIMNQNGISAVVLATGMDRVHTTEERITLKNLEDTARICLALMTA